jgi:hypothetical protein
MDADELDSELDVRLAQGLKRADAATRGSPEWDAAQANLEALEHRLHALRPPPVVEGSHVLSRLGPMVLEDDCLVRGIIAASGPAGEDLRLAISEVPERVHSGAEFADEARRLTDHAGFVLEIEGNELELNFYAWDSELHETAAPPTA